MVFCFYKPYFCVCVEEFTECDVTLNQYILSILISTEEHLKLEKWFKSMKEAKVKISCSILSVELCLKQQNIGWIMLLVLAWICDKSSERLCPTLVTDQRKDHGQPHRLCLPCFVDRCYFTFLPGVLPVPSQVVWQQSWRITQNG